MNGTVFVELPCADCESEPLNGEVAFFPLSLDQALKEFVESQLCVGGRDYHATYTAFHYGEEAYLWKFSHYEAYQPIDSSLPAVVILRYRPIGGREV